jgi:hypothetical protein
MNKIFTYSLFISIFSWLIPMFSAILNFKKGNRIISIALILLFSVYFIADIFNYFLSINGICSFIVLNFYTWISSVIIFWIIHLLTKSRKIRTLIKLISGMFFLVVIYEIFNSNPLIELNNFSYKFSVYSFFSLSFISFFEIIEDDQLLKLKEDFKFLIMVGFFIYFGFLLFYSLFEDLIFSSNRELQIYVLPLQHLANVMYSVIITFAIWKKKPI